VFAAFQAQARSERLARALTQWRQACREAAASALARRSAQRRALGALRRAVDVRRSAARLVAAWLGGEARRLQAEALARWRAAARGAARAARAGELADLVHFCSRRVRLQRGVDAWKRFVMAQEAEHTFGMYTISQVFAQYLERDRAHLLRRAWAAWRAHAQTARCAVFERAAERVVRRRALRDWHRWARGATLGRVRGLLVEHQRALCRSALQRWSRLARARGVMAWSLESWRRAAARARQQSERALQHLRRLTRRRLARVLLAWRALSQETRRAGLEQRLAACSESIERLTQACQEDLATARRAYSSRSSSSW